MQGSNLAVFLEYRGIMSDNELAIVVHLTKGLTSKEIAYEISLSKSSVDLKIRMLCERLNARSRAQLVAIAIQGGFVAATYPTT
jgi:DNA-binding NarL/FixJ family response regulator